MNCPNCNLSLTEMTLDNQHVLHCLSCGGSFFEENGVNRISIESAEKLSTGGGEERKNASPNFCPRDHAALLPLYDDETIPQGLEFFRCAKCHGVFALPKDLITFKRAQIAKVEYFRLWSRPIPSLHAVLVFSFLLVVSAASYGMLTNISKQGSTATRASEIVERTTIIKSGRYTLVSFHTTLPYRSEILLINKATGAQTIKEVAKEPTLSHIVTLTDVDPDQEYFYKIRLTDGAGKVTETEEKKLAVSSP